MLKGMKCSPETIAKMKEWVLHREPHSAESFKRQGESLRRRLQNKKNHPFWGRHHTEESKAKMSATRIGKYAGEKCHRWKGGIFRDPRGYIHVKAPNHPFRTVAGWVYQHRLVIESILNRYLSEKEHVHHVNRFKGDNRPENLIVFVNQTAHNRFEKGCPIKPGDIIFDGRNYHAIATSQ